MNTHEALLLALLIVTLAHVVMSWFIYCKVSQVWTIAKREEATAEMLAPLEPWETEEIRTKYKL